VGYVVITEAGQHSVKIGFGKLLVYGKYRVKGVIMGFDGERISGIQMKKCQNVTVCSMLKGCL
jgi:hypothetical protein